MDDSAKICLGTAQLGLDYGIANRSGRPDDGTCFALLDDAVQRGVVRWDTAPAYGDAEVRLGQFLANCPRRDEVAIVSKLPKPPDRLAASDLNRWVGEQIESSLRNLSIDRLAGCLLHNPQTAMRFGGRIWEAMSRQVERGLVDEVGISVYDPAEAAAALDDEVPRALQVTANLLDSRFLKSESLLQVRKRNGTVYARSVFLQGILTMSAASVPAHMQFVRGALEMLEGVLQQYGVTAMEVALPYVVSQPGIDYALIGVDNASQLDRNLASLAHPIPEGLDARLESCFADIDVAIIEPRRWPAAPAP